MTVQPMHESSARVAHVGVDAQRMAPKRTFGIWLASALVVGNIIGAGIFMLPGGLAPFGYNAVVAWMLTLVGTMCLAWVYAQLARHLPDAGGAFGFMRLAFGEGVAFVGAWGYIVSIWAANAALTVTGVSYLTRLVPSMTTNAWASPLVALTCIWALVAVHARGARAAGVLQLVTTVVKLLPFVAIIGLAFWRLFASRGAVLPAFHASALSLSGTAGAAGLTLFAMLGLESATVPADVVENPTRVIPLATMLGTGLCAIVSLIATCAVALMLPTAVVAASRAPLSDFIAVSWGGIAGGFVAICAVVSCFGCLNGWLLLGGELPAAMADAGTLPTWFSARNGAGAPMRSVLVCAIMTTLLTSMAYTRVGVGAYNFAALLAAATGLLLYGICALAVFRLMRDGRVPKSRGLVVAGGGAFVFSLWALYGSGWEALGWGAVLTAAGWPVYRLAARHGATDSSSHS